MFKVYDILFKNMPKVKSNKDGNYPNKFLRDRITVYYQSKGIRVYSKDLFTFVPISNDIILSAHVDTVCPPILSVEGGEINGMLDNLLGVWATMMIDEVGKVFTDREENDGKGAEAFSHYLKHKGIKPCYIIAIEVTNEGGGNIYLTVENVNSKTGKFHRLESHLKQDKQIKIIYKGEWDEAYIYRKYFSDTFSICIPMKENYHQYCVIKMDRFLKYIDKLNNIIRIIRLNI